MKTKTIADEKYKKRLEQIEFMAEHFDELPKEVQIEFSAKADMAVDIFVRKKVS